MPEEMHEKWATAPQELFEIVRYWVRKRITTEAHCDQFTHDVDVYLRQQKTYSHALPQALAMYCEWAETTVDALPLAAWARAPQRVGFVVPPTDDRGRNGWFPIGQPSIFAGFSGAGKTKLVLQMLDAMRTGENFLSRAIPQKSVLWIQQDRDVDALHESCDDLFDSGPWFPYSSPIEEKGAAAIARLRDLLQEHDYPEVCVVDGLDILLPDLRGPALKDLFPRLQRVAKQCQCALVGTWGSPKRQATKDKYTESRLAATGAAEIGRLSATCALVVRNEDDTRTFTVATRRSADDVFKLMFPARDIHRLVLVDPIAVAKLKMTGKPDLIPALKALGLEWKDVKDQLKTSQATWYRQT